MCGGRGPWACIEALLLVFCFFDTHTATSQHPPRVASLPPTPPGPRPLSAVPQSPPLPPPSSKTARPPPLKPATPSPPPLRSGTSVADAGLGADTNGTDCGGRWWRRLADGSLWREPLDSKCPTSGGGSVWVEVEAPIPTRKNEFPSSIVVTIEVTRKENLRFMLLATHIARARFAAAGSRCATNKAMKSRALDCASHQRSADEHHRTQSEQIGVRNCAHPEAKEARALFCRYPPRFFGHEGICRQYAQFCPFQELRMETDPSRVETAVVNVDEFMFDQLEGCGGLREDLWVFKVFVHWCPHCQQLMPKLYKLALVLRQHEDAQAALTQGKGFASTKLRIRFGAINCATEHALCAKQKWPGHPLLVTRYLGPVRSIHDALGHWEEAVKDAQLRSMLPRGALPGEYPVLRMLLEQLPDDVAPKRVWEPLFDPEPEGAACANLTALHPNIPENADESIGNGWSDYEAEFTPRRHWVDGMFMLRHIFTEWIVPIADDGNPNAFSYDQVRAIEAWVALLYKNLPIAFGIQEELVVLMALLSKRLLAANIEEGHEATGLCLDEWKDLTAPLLARLADVGQRDFQVQTACATETCRMWSLLHILAASGLSPETPSRRTNATTEGAIAVPVGSTATPSMLLSAVRGFLDHFFKCMFCRKHFLRQFDSGAYGLARARENATEAVLYFWRLHNAVSVRVSLERGCAENEDRRWPPRSLCPRCWHSDTSTAIDASLEGRGEAWDVLREAQELAAASRTVSLPRPLRLMARPDEVEVVAFLRAAFLESEATERVVATAEASPTKDDTPMGKHSEL